MKKDKNVTDSVKRILENKNSSLKIEENEEETKSPIAVEVLIE
jgi:hypothetical protein